MSSKLVYICLLVVKASFIQCGSLDHIKELWTPIPVGDHSTGCIIPEYSTLCRCGPTDGHVSCSGDYLTGRRLKQAFGHNNQSVPLYQIEIVRTPLQEILDDSFSPAGFQQILIHHNKELKTIESEAFLGSEMTAKIAFLHENSITGTSVFSALSQLFKLETLYLDRNQIDSIPKHAFSTPFLKFISLSGNRIKTVESRAFFMAHSLSYLDLSSNQLSGVSEYAFNIFVDRKRFLPSNIFKLNLKGNRIARLNQLSFRDMAFRGAAMIDLSLNQLTTINEEAFGDLLRKHSASEIRLRANKKLECDCGFKWIYDYDLLSQIKDVRCNGTFLERIPKSNFDHCLII